MEKHEIEEKDGMREITAEQVKRMMEEVARKVVESEPYLTEIDLKIGDGDHGTGMKRGFSAVLEMLSDLEPQSCEGVFQAVGTCLLDTMGGASGVLFGTVFISGIVKREERNSLQLRDFAEIFSTALSSLKKRGRAKVGDKTMVDALEPAVFALEESVKEDLDLTEGFEKAALAAEKGMEYTKTIKARFGRAKYFGEKAIGLQDAGATSVYIIFRAMSDFLKGEKN